MPQLPEIVEHARLSYRIELLAVQTDVAPQRNREHAHVDGVVEGVLVVILEPREVHERRGVVFQGVDHALDYPLHASCADPVRRPKLVEHALDDINRA